MGVLLVALGSSNCKDNIYGRSCLSRGRVLAFRLGSIAPHSRYLWNRKVTFQRNQNSCRESKSSLIRREFYGIQKSKGPISHAYKMTADIASADNNIPTTVTNRLFLSHIDYTNHNTTENGNEISTEKVRQKLDRLFSKYGSVLEIYLSDKEDPNMLRGKDNHRPPFGFIAMETAQQAQAALNALSNSSQQQQKDKEINDSQNFD